MSRGKLPRNLSGRQFVRAASRLGFELKRQRGSHMVLARAQPPATIVVPDHDVLRVGLLRKLIEQMGASVEEFIEMLE